MNKPKLVMTVVNNEIYVRKGQPYVEILVRDRRNKNKFSVYITDGKNISIVSTDYTIRKTYEMLNDVKNNIMFKRTNTFAL